MSSVRRIVLIVPDCGEGGLFQFYNQLVPELSRQLEVHVIFASVYHVSSAPSIAGAVCHLLHAEDAAREYSQLLTGPLSVAPNLARSLAVAYRAWEKAISLRPDCIEVCDWPLSFVPATLSQSVPYIVQCHASVGQIAEHDPQPRQGIESALAQLIEPQLIAAAHRVQTYSSGNAAFWQAMTNRPVEMIFPAFMMPARANDAETSFSRAAVFGRLQSWKGPHILCEALRMLGSKAPDLDWYGGVKPWGKEGVAADKFLEEAYPDVWGKRFHHRAAILRSAVASIQAEALINIVPSTWDVFNFTAVESMAAGRPTIVSTGAGASELVVDGENGFTFANKDPESLAEAIDGVLTLPEGRRREIGNAGRETIRIALDPRRIAEQRLVAYEDAIRSFAENPPQRPNTWLADFLSLNPEHGTDAREVLEAFPMALLGDHMKERVLRRLKLRGRH